MSVISISGEIGSEGDAIAERVAHTLGYHFADRTIIGSILTQYGLVDFGREYDTAVSIWSHFISQFEDQRVTTVEMLNRVILALAHHGDVVIIGRGSFALLGGFADVFNVRIEAPLDVRVKRVMEQQKIAQPGQAAAIVKESDRARKAFIDWYYGAQWDKSEAFDVVINTGKVSAELAIAWLVEAVRARQGSFGINECTSDTIQVDAILASAVSTALKCSITHPS